MTALPPVPLSSGYAGDVTRSEWLPVRLRDDLADAIGYALAADVLEALEALEVLDRLLAAGRAQIADARARQIADAAAGGSVRQAAVALGLSPSAVAKAVARARALDPPATS